MKNSKPIPGFPKYATDGKDVANIQTGNIMKVKTGTNKYQLFNKENKRKSITIDEIKALLPKTEDKADKKISKKTQILDLFTAGKTASEIATETGFKYNTVAITIKVHRIKGGYEKGWKPEKIAKETGYNLPSVLRNAPSK